MDVTCTFCRAAHVACDVEVTLRALRFRCGTCGTPHVASARGAHVPDSPSTGGDPDMPPLARDVPPTPTGSPAEPPVSLLGTLAGVGLVATLLSTSLQAVIATGPRPEPAHGHATWSEVWLVDPADTAESATADGAAPPGVAPRARARVANESCDQRDR